MGIPVSQIYRVREGKRKINQQFIVGAIKAFLGHKLDELFYMAPESPTIISHCSHQGSADRRGGGRSDEAQCFASPSRRGVSYEN
jgi:hypothetical protein